MLALCLMCSGTYYAENYADIIGLGLLISLRTSIGLGQFVMALKSVKLVKQVPIFYLSIINHDNYKLVFGLVKLNDNTLHKYQFCVINHEMIILKLLI